MPSVLDLLTAAREASAEHPAVRVWWLTPSARLPLTGETARGVPSARRIDLAVECHPDDPPDCSRIERDLSKVLPSCSVTVRVHRGKDERDGMMRLLTLEERTTEVRAFHRNPPQESR
jgi:hypothetical protein